jgi:4-amino-4-deoxy-L-arabinose transferase-like glycosyltransferase
MREKVKHFIDAHFIGLSGILMFFFYLSLILLQTFFPRTAKYSLTNINVIFIVLGTGLVIYSFIPEQVNYMASRFRHWLTQVTDRLTPKSIFLIILTLTVIGFYLRFNNLGSKSFWTDELITTYAAIGLLEHGTPLMPSGEAYTRALLNTYLIALSFKTFGISEFSARIVSVVFGTLIIPIAYLFGKELENKRVGIIAALLITFSAFEILWAREARMYAQFQFFYLLTAYLFYISIKKGSSKLFLFSGLSFIFAWYSHVLSLCFIPVAVTYVLLCKRMEFLKNKNLVYATSGILGIAVVYMILTDKTPLDYYPLTASQLFTLFVLVVISSIILLLLWKLGLYKNKNPLVYLMLNFFIPFIILSISPWKTVRYSFFIFPFLILLASSAIDFYAVRNWGNNNNAICTQTSKAFRVKSELVKNIKTIITVILILLLFIQVSSDIYYVSHDSYTFYHDCPENWKKGCEFVKEHLDEDDKIATNMPLATLYYVGRVDYDIPKGFKDIANNGTFTDSGTGVIVLNNYSLFMQKVKTEKGWLIVDRHRLNEYFTETVRDYIRNNMTFYPEGSDETIEVYSWGDVFFGRG